MNTIFYISNYFPSKDLLFFWKQQQGVELYIPAPPEHIHDGVSQSAQSAVV